MSVKFVNKHMYHIEDALIHHDEEIRSRALKYLKEPHKYNHYLKYDGRVSIVFGRYFPTDEYIIGTKGVFNKTPKYARFVNEIEKMFTGDLQYAMLKIFQNQKLYEVYKDRLVQCDLLFTRSSLINKTEFQPNTILYQQNDLHHFQDADVGIAIHTEYTANLSAKPYNELHYNIQRNVARYPTFLRPPTVTDSISGMYDTMTNYLTLYNSHTNSKNEFEEFRKLVNTEIKKGNKVYNIRLNKIYSTNWEYASIIKNYLIDVLNNDMVVNSKKYPAVPVNGDHEGYVVWVEGYPFKLVNRDIFSYNNFKKWGEVVSG